MRACFSPSVFSMGSGSVALRGLFVWTLVTEASSMANLFNSFLASLSKSINLSHEIIRDTTSLYFSYQLHDIVPRSQRKLNIFSNNCFLRVTLTWLFPKTFVIRSLQRISKQGKFKRDISNCKYENIKMEGVAMLSFSNRSIAVSYHSRAISTEWSFYDDDDDDELNWCLHKHMFFILFATYR